MLQQVIAKTKEEKLHLIYIERDINSPVAVVRDHIFQSFIVEAIRNDPELKEYIKKIIDRI